MTIGILVERGGGLGEKFSKKGGGKVFKGKRGGGLGTGIAHRRIEIMFGICFIVPNGCTSGLWGYV